jgi:hypothetical protein
MSNLSAILAFIGLLSLVVGLTPAPAQAAAHFRILAVRSEYGHLVVEAEHFNPDGSFAYFENYLWQGREGDKHARVTNARGQLMLDDDTVAPLRIKNPRPGLPDTPLEQYRPEGRQWKRYATPHMDSGSITSTIEAIHSQRLITGWSKGQSRLTVSPHDGLQKDRDGVAALVSKFVGLVDIAYAPDDSGSLTLFAGQLPPPNPGRGKFEWGTVTTVYPSLDGYVEETTNTTNYSTIRAAAGDSAVDSSSPISLIIQATTTTNEWGLLRRGILLFDSSSIGDSDIIDSATFEFVVTQKKEDLSSDSVSMVISTPASNSALVAGDYAQTGGTTPTKQAPDIAFTSITADSSTFNVFTLNSTGLGNISKTGITKFGTRLLSDMADANEPTWSSDDDNRLNIASTEEGLPGDKRPKLVITHSAPPTAAITGTIGDGATEQEVRDGGGTIIITLTADTWVAAGGTFDAQRQAIIDGLDSAQSEATGWNAEVRDQLGVTSVVRTSSTIVTVTVAASDVADYRIDDPDVITVTVPNAAVTISSGAITATPTFTVTGAAESVTVAGTLGASGGTAAEVRAGGETITLTLANTKWVASGSTFNAQRQNIIDGMDSNLADQNGWDNRRADFAVGDVVRTSDTAVTITLSASTAYAIPRTETITAVVPASALVYGAALTGAPTFNIVPAFQLDGNRVTSAIDLSSITDVAYCAIGWQATTPTSTSVAVVTSIDGGANYSTATNGECPTGITVGGSLSTIADFRIKVTLATSDNTVTPLVEGLALLVQDVSGPALLYQLNTVPGINITDRSANSNTGTMSFPVSQTGVNATTGVLESTRSTLSLEQLLSVGDIVSPVTGAAASGNIFNQTETGFGSLPFQSMMQTMATGGELPLKFVWVVAIGLFSIALGVVALHLTGSLMISGIGLGAGLSVGAAIGGGLIPGWTVILFVILALALVVMRARGALPL